MALQDLGIFFKKIDKTLVGYINFRGEIKDITQKINEIKSKYIEYFTGPAISVIDYGVYSDGGMDIDICFPISKSFEKNDIKSKYLQKTEVLSILHHGSHDRFGESAQKLFDYLRTHGVLGTSQIRLIHHKYNLQNPEENQVEIQAILHNWDDRLAKNLERVFSQEVSKEILKDREKLFTYESTLDEKVHWIKNVLVKIDNKANDYQKYDILSGCAHEFSQKRINKLRKIYEKARNIEEVLKEMEKDFVWYEGQKKEDDTIFVQKIPYNREGYEKAKNIDEKKLNYCHCPLVKNYLKEGISSTFCYCSAGWYRQYWEGILGKPVQIKILKSLIKGDDVCQFKIYLPQGY